jgi:hypothetical protein
MEPQKLPALAPDAASGESHPVNATIPRVLTAIPMLRYNSFILLFLSCTQGLLFEFLLHATFCNKPAIDLEQNGGGVYFLLIIVDDAGAGGR